MRTVIVGDIHGCYREFKSLLDSIHFDQLSDKLIINGDIMDRGPDSFEVLTEIKRLSSIMGERFIFVRGSHEHQLLHWGNFPKILLWNLVGRRPSIRSFKKHGAQLSAEREWIQEHTVLYYAEERFHCCHAAIKTIPIEDNDIKTLLLDHSTVKQNRYTGKLTITGHIHLKHPTYFDGNGNAGVELRYNEWNPLPQTGVICIDTAVDMTGKLTAMVIEKDNYCLTNSRTNQKIWRYSHGKRLFNRITGSSSQGRKKT